MIERLTNQMRIQSNLSNSTLANTKLGRVTNYSPEKYMAKVILQPEDVSDPLASQTGWLPIFTIWAGNQWGVFAPPSLDDIVVVHFQDATFQGGFISLNGYNIKRLPLSVDSGEFWIVHKSGAYVKLTNDGNIAISSEATTNINGAEVKIGELSSGNLKKLMNEVAQGVYNSHTHSDPQGGTTGIPNQQMDSTSLTAKTEAN